MDTNKIIERLALLKSWQQRSTRLLYLLPLLALVDLVVSWAFGPPFNSILARSWMPIYFVPIIVGTLVVLWTTKVIGLQWQIVATLDSLEEVPLLGSLLEAYGVYDLNLAAHNARTVSDAIGDAIKRLLRKIDTEDECLLDSRQRERLRQLLYPVRKFNGQAIYDVTLVRAVLQTLEAIGSQADVSAIKQLSGKSYLSPELRAEVEVCLARLQDRLAVQQTNSTLLRSSSAVSSSDELLHPSCSTFQATHEDAEQLLRPLQKQDETVLAKQANLLLAQHSTLQMKEQSLRVGDGQNQTHSE